MERGHTSKSFWRRTLLVNPYYFGVLLIGMFAMNIYQISSLEKVWAVYPVYFLLHALIQSSLEVLLLTFIGNIIKLRCHRAIYCVFICLCFFFFVLHYVDFILIRFMDMSVYYSLYWVFQESMENFIELLHLTGISIGTWVFFIFFAVICIPFFGLALYALTEKIAAKKPIKITYKGFGTTLCCLPIGLIAMDMVISPRVDGLQYHHYERSLPWKSTLLSRSEVIINRGKTLKTLPDEQDMLKQIHSVPLGVTKKPNLYLFIVESLRQDFLTEETAKNIKAFRDENITFKRTFSSGNATHISWYSIFHSNYPLYWAEAKLKWKSGSIPLQILKKMGYKVHVYSAAQLKYYGLADVMFGQNHYLADSYHIYPHYYPAQAWESDVKAVDTFMHDLDKKGSEEGNVYVFFLESTHFNYNWPENYPMNFTPISEVKIHLRISNALKNIELTKNRYRNAIHFMDFLFGNVLNTLKDKGIYDESVVIFIGDHGEEFFEEGQLFHGSHLSPMQTEPPIYMKLGDNQRAHDKHAEELVTSHVDIFPTVLDYLLGNQPFQVFDGESIFKEQRKGYIVSGRFNGPCAPAEILISNGEEKGVFKLSHKKTLEIRSIKWNKAKAVDTQASFIQQDFSPAINALFN